MNEPKAPKIEFPCPDYVIKTMGTDDVSFKDFVVQTLKKYDPQLNEKRVTSRPSAKGTFVSVSVFINAQSEQQLKDIFADLKKDKRVKMVL